MIYVIIRKCCLGPNCSRNHGSKYRDFLTGEIIDKRVWVVQWVTRDETKAKEVKKNWEWYESKIVSVEEAMSTIEPDSAKWLKEKIESGRVHPDYDKEGF